MAKRNSRNTRGRIISAAWKLFYEQGYDGTTVEDIVFESGTSKGSFYHYFDGKDALMGTLAYVFDEKYEDLMPTLDPEKGAIETLAYINHELYVMIESSVSIDLLTRLLSTQLLARGEKHLLDRSRVYFRLLKKIVRQGAERGKARFRFRAMNNKALAYELLSRKEIAIFIKLNLFLPSCRMNVRRLSYRVVFLICRLWRYPR